MILNGKRFYYCNKVFHDDIMNLLAKLPDNSIDMIFGDPDYNVNINYGGKNYTTDFDGYIQGYIALTKECMRVLKEDGNLMMMNYPKPNAHLRAKFLDDSGAVPVEMKAGQVAIFSSLTLHMSGPNTSNNSTRRGYVPQYHVPDVILKKTGQPIGDQFPVLRNGHRIN